MAEQLVINLTDTEVDRMVEVAQIVAPGATAAQIRAWATEAAKRGLRAEVRQILLAHSFDQAREILDTDWPIA